jgi:transcription termination factor Rho
MSIISPADLEASPLADLHALASALGIDGYRRLRKDDLVDAILERQGASVPARRSRRAAADAEPDAPDAGDGDAPARPARSGRSRRAVAEPQDAVPAEDGDAQERPPRSGRSRRRGGRGRGRDGEGAPESDARAESPRAESARAEGPREDAIERIAEGVVELLPNGSGFLRAEGEDDVYISAAQARRCELVAGDRVSGPVRAARRSERHPSLVRVDTINGVAADEAVVGTRIDDLEVDFPSVAFALGDDPVLAALASAAPIGRGSRVVICGPARSGRTDLLRRIAAALATAGGGLEVELLAVGVRPEELSEWKTVPYATASGLSFAASADAQEAAVEQAAERGRRIAIRGGDAVLLIDTLDGLSPGAARRALAAARDLRGAGSLTVIATAREALGGETTVAALSGAAAVGTLDPVLTGTLRADTLVAAKPVRKPRAPRKPRVAPTDETAPQ